MNKNQSTLVNAFGVSDKRAQVLAENARNALVDNAQSFASTFWYLFPVVVILCVGLCQGICVRFCAWSDRRRMKAFTKRSCLQKMRSRLCRACDHGDTSTETSGAPASPAPRAGEPVRDSDDVAPLTRFPPASNTATPTKSDKNDQSRSPATSVTSFPAGSCSTAPYLDSSANDATNPFNKSPMESQLSTASEAPSLTSSFDDTPTPRCVPSYSVTQKRSIEQQRRATVDDWIQAKRAMGELHKSDG